MKMFKVYSLALVLALLSISTARAAEEKSARGFNIPGIEKISEYLGKDTPLTDEQKTKIEAAREEIKKKFSELREKPEVVAAREGIEKARKDGDEAAMKEARTKMEAALGGWNQRAEFVKLLTPILSKDQLAKYEAGIATRSPRKEGDAKEGDAKKEDAPKKD